MTASDAIRNRAAQWIIARDEPDWAAPDQLALDAWLAESDRHKAAFWRLQHGWTAADRLAALGRGTDAAAGESTPHSPAGRAPVRMWSFAAVAASLLLFAAIALVHRYVAADIVPRPARTVAFATSVGGHRLLGLSDGSKVEMNTDSRVRATLDGDGRSIWLDRGEAFFEVAHRDGQPFVVHAGPRAITVLGTKFSVRRRGDQISVFVLEGRVRVDDVVRDGATRPTLVTAGDIALTQGASTLVTTAADDRVADALSWRAGMLSFKQERLADIVAEFNRYNTRRIVIEDPRAADLRIGGSFPAQQPGAFARLLRDAYGMTVVETDATIEISER